jgi:hypothetical protein
MNISLYRFASDLAVLERITDEETSIELSQEELVGLIKNKVDSYADYCRFINDRIIAIETRVDQLEELKKKEHSKIKSLHKYAMTCLDILEVKSLSGIDSKISIQNNPSSVEITNESGIPLEYLKTKVVETVSIDKLAIKEMLKRGENISGAVLKESRRVVIK